MNIIFVKTKIFDFVDSGSEGCHNDIFIFKTLTKALMRHLHYNLQAIV